MRWMIGMGALALLGVGCGDAGGREVTGGGTVDSGSLDGPDTGADETAGPPVVETMFELRLASGEPSPLVLEMNQEE
ncbi:MAG: hypothetical protein K0V04_43915, partial [Deltaproteobacteria bacterium]|nr:hypothetical protein [Deltaproteobacteria bacterium]